MKDIFCQCLGAFVGCLGFAFIFRLQRNMKFVLLGALNGLIATAIYLLVPINSVYFQSFIAMLVSALIAELLARIMKAPATVFIVIGCFPLVPGRGIYQTMLYAVRSDSTMFIQSFLRTFGTAMSLALAILVSSTIILVYRKLKTQPDLLFKDPYE